MRIRAAEAGSLGDGPPPPSTHHRISAPPQRPRVEVIIIRESIWRSLCRDIGTLILFAALIGLGRILGSTVMEWVGALVAMFAITSMALRPMMRNRLTVSEARARLDEIERGEP